MTRDLAGRLLVAGRLVVGGSALVAPRLVGRLFGIDPAANPAAPYVARLFGVRAVFMALLLANSEGEERDRELRAGVAVDLIDAYAAVLAWRNRELWPAAAAAAGAAALTEAALGLTSSVPAISSATGGVGDASHRGVLARSRRNHAR